MLKILETPKSVAILAGVVCYFIAFSVLVAFPSLLTDADEPKVVGVDGVSRDVPNYTPHEAAGRETYGTQICWHCHSQFVRPVNDEDKRWGPVSQTGEYAWDLPHFFGTRRTGPDLHREGGLRIDDWHEAHFYNPRYTVPHSVMPGFTWLFQPTNGQEQIRRAIELLDTNGDGVISTKIGDDGGDAPAPLSTEVAKVRALASSQDPFTRLDQRGVRGPGKSVDSMWWVEMPNSGEGLLTDYDAGPRPTAELLDLETYVQRLGTTIGKWRRPLSAATPPRVSPFDEVDARPRRTSDMRAYGFLRADPAKAKAADDALGGWRKTAGAWDQKHPLLAQRLQKGKELFDKNCAGCHGAEGRGNGSAAQFLLIRPRDFTVGKYKYKSTPVGFQPLDGDIYRSLFRGLPGSAMPPWREMSDEQLWLLVDYVKSFYEGDRPFNDRGAVVPPPPPQRFDPDPSKELARGRAVYMAGQCYNCHGKEGRADGPGWNDTTTEWGGALRPRDFRPRISPSDAATLYPLFARQMESLVGAEAWKTLSAAPAWKALEPKSDDASKAFVLFLLGEGPRARAMFGEDAVKKAFGDRYEKLFSRGDDALEDLRMAVATEKDQPSLRMRGGAYPEDLYRTIMTGLEGTQMKIWWDQIWKKTDPKLETRPDLSKDRKERNWLWTQVYGDRADKKTWKKLSISLHDPVLAEVGVFTEKNDKGQDEEYIVIQPGDDWALVHYVQWLMCLPRSRSGN